MSDKVIRWAKWIAGALALAFSLAVASLALRPSPAHPQEPSPGVEDPQPLSSFPVPSGRHVALQQVLSSAEGLRFRFVAPGIADADFDEIEVDMEALCEAVVVPALGEAGRSTQVVILSLADAPIPFGQTNPAVTQYFDSYRVEGGDCIWEGF